MNRSVSSWACCWVLPALLLAGGLGTVEVLAGPRVLPVHRVRGVHYARYDLRTGQLTPTTSQTRVGYSLWAATAESGYFWDSMDFGTNGLGWLALDWGDLADGSRVDGYALAYATDVIDHDIDCVNVFYAEDNGFNSAGHVPLAAFELTGLGHGDPNLPGSYISWIITVDLAGSGQSFTIAGGDLDADGLTDFSYTYWFPNAMGTVTGPFISGDPNVPGQGAGMEDAFDAFEPVDPNDPNTDFTYVASYWFGGDPFAQFYMELFGQPPAPLTVSNVRARQRHDGSMLVDIYYDLENPDGNSCYVWLSASGDGGQTWDLAPATLTGDIGDSIAPDAAKHIVWDVGADLPDTMLSDVRVRLSATDLSNIDTMVVVPSGGFAMGDPWSEGEADERPVHWVWLSSYWIDSCEVTNQQYADALNWAWGQGGLIRVSNGIVYQASSDTAYCYTSTAHSESRITWNGSTFGVLSGYENHPVYRVSWYGAAAYCNWRSVRNGRDMCYDYVSWECDFGASGYRLPTEAEWEKAAAWDPVQGYHYRFGEQSDGCGTGCLDGHRANYFHSGDPYESDSLPTTTPVGFYNGRTHYKSVHGWPGSADRYSTALAWSYYHCFDMTGNQYEWCNDYYDGSYYAISPHADPTGPATGEYRVVRGGCWLSPPIRTADRGVGDPQVPVYGFRCVTRSQTSHAATCDSSRFLVCTRPSPSLLVVAAGAPPNGDGSTWASAFDELAVAVEAAACCGGGVEQIWVAQGSYTPLYRGLSSDARDATFDVPSGVRIYGGLAGDEDPNTFDLSTRDPAAHPTILTGDLAANDADPNAADPLADNAYHVVTMTDCDDQTVLDGVFITAGRADEPNAPQGGGVLIAGGSPALHNCTFSNNTALGGGALAATTGATPTIEHCVFQQNDSLDDGGAIAVIQAAAPEFFDCLLVGNTAADKGGAVVATDSSPGFDNCTFSQNAAPSGGALWGQNGHATVVNSIFWGNGPTPVVDASGDMFLINCDVEGGWNGPGAGNFDGDPLFVSGPAGDFYLRQDCDGDPPYSPCVDAGNDTAWHVGLDARVTRSDHAFGDSGLVDLGYHYPPGPLDLCVSTELLSNQCVQRYDADPQVFELWKCGDGTRIDFAISDDADWLTCTPATGSSTGDHVPITVSYQTADLPCGTYSATITITDPNAASSPVTVGVELEIQCAYYVGGRIFLDPNDPNGSPLADVPLTLDGPAGSYQAVTGPDGTWLMPDVLEGTYTLTPMLDNTRFVRVVDGQWVGDAPLDIPADAAHEAENQDIRLLALYIGDVTRDCRVDLADLSVLLTYYGQHDMGWFQGDFTGDGYVGLDDLTWLLAAYGTTCTD